MNYANIDGDYDDALRDAMMEDMGYQEMSDEEVKVMLEYMYKCYGVEEGEFGETEEDDE